jgi:YD repeat-containing protein
LEIVALSDGRYRAYFQEGANEIKSALSNDGGKTFTLEEGARAQGSVPATIQLPDGQWRMYYASQGEIVSATSRDGLTFTNERGIRIERGKPGEFDEFGITHPSIVALPDGSYRMYYDGQFRPEPGPYWRIMSARSKDGLHWTKDEGSRIPVNTKFGDFEAELAFSSHVEYRDGTYTMYFSSQGNPISASGIWRATSSNGIDFTVGKHPILGRDPAFGNQQDTGTAGGPKGMPQDPFVLTAESDRLYYWTSDKGYQSALRKQ